MKRDETLLLFKSIIRMLLFILNSCLAQIMQRVNVTVKL
jgi:hypothetical protein